MRKSVSPSELGGTVAAPPSKSLMQRAAAAALLCDNPVTILNPGRDEDSRSALRVVQSLGAGVEETEDRAVIRSGSTIRETRLDCGQSGLCLRMFTPIAALFDQEFELTGSGSLVQRPVGPIAQPLRELGAVCATRDGYLPVTVKGPLGGGHTRVDASLGSQFLTGLLMALPKAGKDSELSVPSLVSIPYIRLTLGVLEHFGVAVRHQNFQVFWIPGGQSYTGSAFRVEGDWSGAAFLLVAAALAGPVRVQGLDPDSLQGDRRIIDILRGSGAAVKVTAREVEVRPQSIESFKFDVTDCPDLAPPLVALASRAQGTSEIRGMSRLVHKESNRAQTLLHEFQALGVDVRLEGERLLVRGGLVRGGEVDSHGDHRLAMALAVAGLAAQGDVSIEGAECVIKSYPAFFEDLRSLGGRVHE